MFRLISGPREGWFSLLLLLAVVLAPALSLAEAAWVDDLWIIPWLAFFSLLLGAVLAKLPVRGRVAHPFAVVVGLALVAFYFAALPPRGDWETRFLWLGGRVWTWVSVAFGGGMSNDGMLFALLMSLTAWLMGYASAWFAFRVHTVWPPLVACGSGLLVNLSYAPPDALPHFLLFLLSAMLLLTRITLFQKERDWNSVDADYNRRLTWNYIRGSAVLSVAIVAVAWAMPTGTVNATVAENWYNITGPWQGLQVEFDRLFASVGSSTSKVEGNRFAKTLALKGAIELGPDPVLLVASPLPEYWAAQTYDRYTGQGWMSSADVTTRLDPNDQRLAETSLYRGRQDIEQRFKLLVGRTTSLFAASSPVKLSLPTYADHFGTLDELAGLRTTIPLRQGQLYGVISSVSTASADQLRKSGTSYPEWTRRYLELPFSSTLRTGAGSRVATMARRVARDVNNPYDAALALESYLRGFKYETRVPSPPPDRDAVDWFLFVGKEGYCDYFASAMAVMARTLGIPSRVVTGYNTGAFDQQTGLYEVRQENAHSWPELFFPGYGWVRFEPTPSQPVPERIEALPEDETPEGGDPIDGSDLEALDLDLTSRDKLLLDDEYGFYSGDGDGSSVVNTTIEWTLFLLPIVLIVGALVLLLAVRLLLSRLNSVDRAYLQMYWVASLLGWRLRPSQTPGEYARVLSEASHELRPDVQAIVGSYVEKTYAGRSPAGEGVAWQSWRRMRLKLPLRLLMLAVSHQRSANSR